MSLPHTSTTESDSQSHDLGPAVAAVSDKEREGVAEEEGKIVDQQVHVTADTTSVRPPVYTARCNDQYVSL